MINKVMFQHSRINDCYGPPPKKDSELLFGSKPDTFSDRKIRSILASAWQSAVPDDSWKSRRYTGLARLQYGNDAGKSTWVNKPIFRFPESWIFNGGRKNNFVICHSYYTGDPGIIEYKFEDTLYSGGKITIDLIGIVLDSKYSWFTGAKSTPIFWSVQDIHDQIAPVIQSFQDNYDRIKEGRPHDRISRLAG